MMGWLHRRVGTRPEQEQELEAAIDELLAEIKEELRAELRRSREDLGQIMGEDEFDAGQMGDLFSRHDETLGRLRRALVGALARIHDVLDPEQRGRLAELLRAGDGPWMGGPYRSRA